MNCCKGKQPLVTVRFKSVRYTAIMLWACCFIHCHFPFRYDCGGFGNCHWHRNPGPNCRDGKCALHISWKRSQLYFPEFQSWGQQYPNAYFTGRHGKSQISGHCYDILGVNLVKDKAYTCLQMFNALPNPYSFLRDGLTWLPQESFVPCTSFALSHFSLA